MTQALKDLGSAAVDHARRLSRDEWLAWVPTVTVMPAKKVEVTGRVRPLVIPIHWRNYTAHLALCLE